MVSSRPATWKLLPVSFPLSRYPEPLGPVPPPCPPRRLYVIRSVNLARGGGEVERETKNTAARLDSCGFCY